MSKCFEDDTERDVLPSSCPVDPPTGNTAKAKPRNGETTSSSPESGSLNGDGKRSGKSRRRKKRSSNSESRADEEAPANRVENRPEAGAGLTGLRSECSNVWLERSMYERAESLYQCWLVSSSNGTTKPSRSLQASGKQPRSSPRSAGQRGNPVPREAVNELPLNQGRRGFSDETTPPFVPSSLNLQGASSRSITPRTPDEGYQSQTPTPATPVIQPVTPTTRESVNGLPRLPVELLRDVWLDKPLYDRAEAAYYQNLYDANSSKRPGNTPTSSRSGEHPQSLVEEEEEEEEQGKEAVVEQKRVATPGKAEVFHALHPIQEEEEPVELPESEDATKARLEYLVHPDSERVWLDKWRFDAAESRFHSNRRDTDAGKKKKKEKKSEANACVTPRREKKMNTSDFLVQERIWFDKPRYDEAEKHFYERMNGSPQPTQDVGSNTILQDIARARENIQKSLAGNTTSAATNTTSCVEEGSDQRELISRIQSLELQTQSFYEVLVGLKGALSKLESQVCHLDANCAAATTRLAHTPSVPNTNGTGVQKKSSAPVEEEKEEEEDDDIDLFGSDDDDEEAEKLKEQRLKEYAEKKAKKPALIAKSSILLDVKPWDDETDMAKLEECVRSVQADGLLWGTSKLVPVGYGIKKLQIACVVEDDKVGTDLLEEEITKFEDFVQSVDVAAFNKI